MSVTGSQQLVVFSLAGEELARPTLCRAPAAAYRTR
jgi:hypothetical protein